VLPFETVRAIRDKLTTAAWVAEQLQLNITRQTQSGTPYRDGGKSTDTPLVFDDRASEADWILRNTLAAHSIDASGCRCDPPTATCELPVTPPPRGTVALARWLLNHSTRITDTNALEEISAAVDYGHSVIDCPAVRIYLGDCECGEKLYGDPEATEILCGRCACVHNPSEKRAANNARARDYPVTASDAARFVGAVCGLQLTPGRIRVWASRGKITALGVDQDGHNLYRLGDVVDTARAVAQ
jgi:hypothetical protein